MDGRELAGRRRDGRRSAPRGLARLPMCQHCDLQMKVDLGRIKRSKGASYDPLGPHRRLQASIAGKANFACRPDRSDEDVAMVRIR